MKLSGKAFLPLILLALLTLPLEAQKKSYSPGHIVTLEGDTLQGWIKDRSSGTFTELYSRIRFKAENAFFRKKISADEILGYACNGKVYETVPLCEASRFFTFRYYVDENYGRVFLRLVSREGPLSYYHWEYVDAESSYLDYIPLFYLYDSDQMVRVTQGILGLKKKRLGEYFYNCPELIDAIYSGQVNEIQEVYDFYLDHCADL
jgi:hypothetical protein